MAIAQIGKDNPWESAEVEKTYIFILFDLENLI